LYKAYIKKQQVRKNLRKIEIDSTEEVQRFIFGSKILNEIFSRTSLHVVLLAVEFVGSKLVKKQQVRGNLRNIDSTEEVQRSIFGSKILDEIFSRTSLYS
jgi:hypothetical protein